MTTPLVTVITPCFDDNDTLPLALTSLMTQTMGDWECVVIDDGSRPGVRPIVEAFGDPRLRLHSFAENRGRPVARQKGLEMARGQFICMLDADDWYYPDKLRWQLEVMRSRPDLVAVSAGMAVVDRCCRLTGMRTFAEDPLEIRTCQPPCPPRIAFSPIMIRRHIALAHRFNPRLKRSEDPDYLMRILGGERYGVMARPVYVYREEFSRESMNEALSAFSYQRLFYRGHLRGSPLLAPRQYLWNLVKTAVYGAARKAGRGRWLFERRNQAPTTRQRREFGYNKEEVMELYRAKNAPSVLRYST
jgi:glycosyltransferase involved in cell wall biosynthesis